MWIKAVSTLVEPHTTRTCVALRITLSGIVVICVFTQIPLPGAVATNVLVELLTVSSTVTHFLLSLPKCLLNRADLGQELSLR